MIDDERIENAMTAPAPPLATCRCGATWPGLDACHCGRCHETFLNVAAFEAHRRSNRATKRRGCHDPRALGMVMLPSARPTYWGPAPLSVADRRARRAAILARQRPSDANDAARRPDPGVDER